MYITFTQLILYMNHTEGKVNSSYSMKIKSNGSFKIKWYLTIIDIAIVQNFDSRKHWYRVMQLFLCILQKCFRFIILQIATVETFHMPQDQNLILIKPVEIRCHCCHHSDYIQCSNSNCRVESSFKCN